MSRAGGQVTHAATNITVTSPPQRRLYALAAGVAGRSSDIGNETTEGYRPPSGPDGGCRPPPGVTASPGSPAWSITAYVPYSIAQVSGVPPTLNLAVTRPSGSAHRPVELEVGLPARGHLSCQGTSIHSIAQRSRIRLPARRTMAVVRFTTSGELQRIGLSPIVDLLPALREEWAGLKFGRDGQLINALTGRPVTSFALRDGEHRQLGARYRATVTTPKYELPEDRRAEFENESRELSERNAMQEAWNDHFARRREASIQVGTKENLLMATLREDNSKRLSFLVSDEHQRWTVEFDVEHERLPKIGISGTIDLTAQLKADGTPGCLSTILGGTGVGAGTVDLAAAERGGRAVDAKGRANRFGGSLMVEVRASASKWAIDGRGVLGARGIARPILWFAGRRIRRSIEKSLAEFWSVSASHMSDLDRELQRLRAAIAKEGGTAPFVRRALWDEDFDPGLDPLSQRA